MSIILGRLTKRVEALLKGGALPSFFDFYVIAFIALFAFWRNGLQRNFIYIFGAIGLWCVSLGCEQRRRFKSLSLSLFSLLALVNIYLHAWDKELLKLRLTSKYINVCILSESFIFIFASIIILKLIYEYAKEYRYYIPFIIIGLVGWGRRAVHQGSMSLMLSAGLAILIYVLLNKKKLLGFSVLSSAILVVLFNWKWICFKFYPRPLVWRQLWDEFLIHPFIGQGYWRAIDFNKGDLIWVKYDLYGPLYRHNDWLNLGIYIGVLGIIFIGWFMLKKAWSYRHTRASIVLWFLIILPFFQMTMLELYKAGMVVFALPTAMLCGEHDKQI